MIHYVQFDDHFIPVCVTAMLIGHTTSHDQ